MMLTSNLKVVNHAENVSKSNTSKLFCVDRRRLWCKQKEQLAGSGTSSKRLPGGGRKPELKTNWLR